MFFGQTETNVQHFQIHVNQRICYYISVYYLHSVFPRSYLEIFWFYMRKETSILFVDSSVLWTYFNQLSPHYYQSKNAIRRFGVSCFLQSLNQQCHFEFILLGHVTAKKMFSLVLYKSPLLDHFSVCCNSE